MDSEDFLYHVTYAAYIPAIADGGIAPGMGSSMGGGGLQAHKAGRIFVTEDDGVSFWYGRSEEWAFDSYDNWAEIELIPVVIRFPRENAEDGLEEDEPGTRDSGADAWMIEGAIVDDLEVYVEGDWISIEDWDTDPAVALDTEGSMLSDFENPLFPSDL